MDTYPRKWIVEVYHEVFVVDVKVPTLEVSKLCFSVLSNVQDVSAECEQENRQLYN